MTGIDSISMSERASRIRDTHHQLFGNGSDDIVVACAPGRAEILGNHTDYNGGTTLSTNVSRNLLIAATPRRDNILRIASPNEQPDIFSYDASSADSLLAAKTPAGNRGDWTNYVKGVLWAYAARGCALRGFNAVIESTIPPGGGLSSSAALETAVSRLVVTMNGLSHTAAEQVVITKSAENDYVGAPCGYLDQATVGLANGWLLIDYGIRNQQPFTYETVSAGLPANRMFVVGYDPLSKHSLVEGKYAKRQKLCFGSLTTLRIALRRYIQNISEVTPSELNALADDNYVKFRLGRRALNYVTHVVYENERVRQAAPCIRNSDTRGLGELMTASGDSALNLYELDEDAPELRFVYETVAADTEDFGAYGIRNMGGGFNATTLALIDTDALPHYQEKLGRAYTQQFGRDYHFVDFTPAPPARIL